MKDLMQIGAFAQRAKVTVKTLRFYADEGLLLPAQIDPQTGYRYYRPGQLRLLTMILNLREAGLGLPAIRTLMDAGVSEETLAQLLAAQHRDLMRERALIDARIRIVEILAASFLKSGEAGLSDIRLVINKAELSYCLRRRVSKFGEEITAMFEQAERDVAQHHARAERYPFLLFHNADRLDDKFDIEVCIPVNERAAQHMPTRVIPGGELVCSLTYQGAYTQTEPLQRKMTDWLKHAGLSPSGPLREIYHRFGADQRGYRLPAKFLVKHARDYVTELQMAVTDPFTAPTSPTKDEA